MGDGSLGRAVFQNRLGGVFRGSCREREGRAPPARRSSSSRPLTLPRFLSLFLARPQSRHNGRARRTPSSRNTRVLAYFFVESFLEIRTSTSRWREILHTYWTHASSIFLSTHRSRLGVFCFFCREKISVTDWTNDSITRIVWLRFARAFSTSANGVYRWQVTYLSPSEIDRNWLERPMPVSNRDLHVLT